MKMQIMLAFAGLAIAAPVMADTYGSERRLASTERRDARQDNRIANGLESGRINTQEAARLNAQQARIDRSQARLASDGHFGRRDALRVNARQTHASRTIARVKRNGR